jgi:transposase
MLGNKDRQEDLFIIGSIKQFIPEDHILLKVDKILDLSWLEGEVKHLYCLDNGRPSLNPEVALRLMLAGFLHNIIYDRALIREAQVNLAIRWFVGFGLGKDLPDHSTLTLVRQRWGAELFRKIFLRTVGSCVKAGLVGGKTMHLDATLIRADVSWESLTTEYVEKTLTENPEDEKPPPGPVHRGPGHPRTKPRKAKKRSKTDPDSTLATSRKDFRLEPSFKQHTAVDDQAGVIVDVEVTTGEANEGERLLSAVDRIEETLGARIETVTADGSYAHSRNYRGLEERGIDAVIPPQPVTWDSGRIPARRFKYDALHQSVRCPMGKELRRMHEERNGWLYRARSSDCRRCPLRGRCFSLSANARTIRIVQGYEALVRARRRREQWGERECGLYARHRWRSEGTNAEGKNRHGLRRAVRRGIDNVAIQSYLTASAMNLKRLARALQGLHLWSEKHPGASWDAKGRCDSHREDFITDRCLEIAALRMAA